MPLIQTIVLIGQKYGHIAPVGGFYGPLPAKSLKAKVLPVISCEGLKSFHRLPYLFFKKIPTPGIDKTTPRPNVTPKKERAQYYC